MTTTMIGASPCWGKPPAWLPIYDQASTKPTFVPTITSTPPLKTTSVPHKPSKLWLEEGNAHSGAGRYKEALLAYNEVLILSPQDAITYNNRGLAYNALEEYEKAIA